MRNAFQIITKAMREIVHRIDAPFITGMMVVGVADPVQDRIAHPNIWRSHVDLCSQSSGGIRKFPVFHSSEQIEALLDRAIPPGTVFSGAIRRAAILLGLFRG